MSGVLSKEMLEAAGKDFLVTVKRDLKQFWESYPEQTKKDIADTATFAAALAAKLAVGQTADYDAEYRHLNAQLASIKCLGAIAFRTKVEDILTTAARLAGTFLQKAVQQALTGGTLPL